MPRIVRDRRSGKLVAVDDQKWVSGGDRSVSGKRVDKFQYDRLAAADASEGYARDYRAQAAVLEAEAETLAGNQRVRCLRKARRLKEKAARRDATATDLRTNADSAMPPRSPRVCSRPYRLRLTRSGRWEVEREERDGRVTPGFILEPDDTAILLADGGHSVVVVPDAVMSPLRRWL